MKNTQALKGNLYCFLAYFIFGFNIIFCKNIAADGTVSPIVMFLLRSGGALILFLLLSLVSGHGRKMELRDLWKVAVASFLGLFLTQLSFLKAVTMATALDVSILAVLSPIMTMIVAAVFLKDRITLPGVIGLSVSVAGVLVLILNTTTGASGVEHTTIGGVLLMIVNTFSFACYVGIFKPLIQKYSVVCFMKWMFLFSTLYALPLGIRDFVATDFAAISPAIAGQILFVVVFATFVAYFLIPAGQKRIRPVIVCMYSYVQPVVAMAISIWCGMDTMTWTKAFAALAVFAGVTIINFVKN
ncbi:MAG: DMT family transporter [Bacteroidales bacterium]|nr:DMT family transporter [Bacteroidales bacterium]